jgi:hypothetical protein
MQGNATAQLATDLVAHPDPSSRGVTKLITALVQALEAERFDA